MITRSSRPVEDWTEPHKQVDVLIVGSGYGGSVAAYRLARTDRKVVVLERGREYRPGEFPSDLGDVPGHVQFRRPNDAESIGYADGLYDIRFGDDVDVLVGSGLGGTSLINANVAVEPDPSTFAEDGWPSAIARDAADDTSRFRRSFGLIRDLIGIAEGPLTAKRAALEKLARSVRGVCKPAQITVSLVKGKSSAGIPQEACTQCGNCVTGCNVGAKNTLAMNLIPLARQNGAHFYTGASVVAVERSSDADYPWLVRYRRTATIKKPLAAETYVVKAKAVVLAAGTLGSTEILLKSKKPGELEFSSKLGARFSTNGDGLAAGYAQSEPVGAMGQTPQDKAWSVGPTICGMAQVSVKDDKTGHETKLTIEDGAIPAALHHLFGELITTGAQAARLVDVTLPAWYRRAEAKDADPIAVHAGAMGHTQVLLVMGDDGAGGTLELTSGTDSAGRVVEPHVKVVWRGAGENPALRAADKLLSGQDRRAGFGKGQYVANPLWKILPDKASDVMSGTLPGGRVITVHPLGGCVMADDVEHGVVNDRGNVYAMGAQSEVHHGLYVLDGAIVPHALGVNPFLTICALAWRGCDEIDRYLDNDGVLEPYVEFQVQPIPAVKPDTANLGEPAKRGPLAARIAEKYLTDWWVRLQRLAVMNLLPHTAGMRFLARRAPVTTEMQPLERDVAVELSELLVGELDDAPSEAVFGPAAARFAQYRGFLLHVTMAMPSVERWYSNPGVERLSAQARIYVNPQSEERVRALHACEFQRSDLDQLTPLATLEGQVRLFGRVPCGAFIRWWRALLAIVTYAWRRRSAESWLKTAFNTEKRCAFWNVALNHTDYRTMTYELRGRVGIRDVVLRGEKLLAWKLFHRRICSALTTLPITLETACGDERDIVTGTLDVNMEYMATDGLAQVRSTPHLPATVSAMSGIGMYFVRALLQTSFWEFGAPKYPRQPIAPRPDCPALHIPGHDEDVTPEFVALDNVPVSAADPTPVPIWLTRYRQRGSAERTAEPVLLLHGLAQGSLIYTTDAMDQNMAAYLWQRGYDVWLLDYRLSNRVLRGLKSEAWSMDEIARYDISTAVKHVYRATRQPVRVFAHCVGATTLAMAVLKGWVNRRRLRSVAFNAIHPWVITSPVNRFRSALGNFFRDAVGRDLLDPIPQVNATAAQVVLDRVAFSLGRYNEDLQQRHCQFDSHELAQAICDRMTFLYGRMWRHENLDPRLHSAFSDMLGPAPGSVYRQLYYLSKVGRVTDAEGQNVYLTEDNIKRRWTFDTMFFHGELSEVFNPQSATRSAVRLRAVLDNAERPKQRVWLRRVPGYGHMDVVFAKDACQTVYPVLDRFFRGIGQQSPDAYDETSDVDYAAPLDLTTGAIVRAGWRDNGRVCLRLWGEVHDDVTSRIVGLDATGAGTRTLAEHGLEQREPRYRVLDLEIADDIEDPVIPVRGKVDSPITWPSGDRGVYFHWNAQQVYVTPAQAGGKLRVALPHAWSWLNRLRMRAQGRVVDELHFLVGSCRYPGTMFERDAADAVFAGMARHLTDDDQGRTGVDMLFLVGDQIYADATAGLADSASWRERYSAQYRDAFGAPNLKAVLSSVPTHIAIDDHEFVDDWSGLPQAGDPAPVDEHANERMDKAKLAAACFQSAGRDLYPVMDQPRTSSPFWYATDDSNESTCPVFVMDTRTERRLRTASIAASATLIAAAQWQALKDWLVDAQKRDAQRPKFLFCGSVIAPVSREYVEHPASFGNEDGWLGYPHSFAALARFIVDEGIENLVIVAGDLHFSAVTKLDITCGGREAVVWHVVSSGLYAPMPFANAHSEDMALQGAIPIYGHDDIDLHIHGAVLCEAMPHFVRVDATLSGKQWQLRVSAHDARGAAVTRGTPPPGVASDGGAWTIAL